MSRQARTQKAAPAQTHAQATARRANASPAPDRRTLVTDRAVPDVGRHRDTARRAPLPLAFVTCDAVARSRDPAAVVDWVRAGPRTALPHRDAVESILGRPLGQIDVVLGGRAAAACDLLGARAFAAGNLIAFSTTSPSPAQILHEAAHALQQSGAPLPRTPLAEGSLPLARPEARAERDAAAIARGASAATLAPAPLGVYRDTESSYDDKNGADLVFKEPYQQQFLRFILESTSRPKKIKAHETAEEKVDDAGKPKPATDPSATQPAVFGILTDKAKKLFDPRYQYSSTSAFQFKQFWALVQTPSIDPKAPPAITKEADATAAWQSATKDDLFKTQGVKVNAEGNSSVDRKVMKIFLASVAEATATGESKSRGYRYALIGQTWANKDDPRPAVQETAAGAGDKPPADLITDYLKILTNIRTANKGKDNPKLGDNWKALEDLMNDRIKRAGEFTETQLYEEARKIRHRLATKEDNGAYGIIVTTYDDISDLDTQVIASGAFFGSYNSLKGSMFETWIEKYPQTSYRKIDTSVEPVFGRELKGDPKKIIQSEKLLALRRGDGLIQIENGEHIIAEAKAYSSKPPEKWGGAPDKEHILQMQDYARVIKDPDLYGYLRSKDTEKILAKVKFKGIHYYFSSENVAKLWIPELDRYLPGMYQVMSPEGVTSGKKTPKAELVAYKNAIVALKKLAASKTYKGKFNFTKLDAIAKDIDTALGNLDSTDAATKEVAEKSAPTDAGKIKEALALEIGAGCSDLDTLYNVVINVRGAQAVFDPVYGAILGLIFEKWIDAFAKGRNLSRLQLPLRGTPAAVAPLVSALFLGSAAKSTRLKNVIAGATSAGSDDIKVNDDQIVIDLRDLPAPTDPPTRPSAEDENEMDDYKKLISATPKIFLYYQAKEGASNTVVGRSYDKVHYYFKDVAAATPWKAAYSKRFPKNKFEATPDPTAPETLFVILSANPTFKLKVEKADELNQTFGKDAIKQSGVAVESIQFKLKEQRKPDIESGTITMSIAAGDLVKSDKPAAKPIKPPLTPPKPGTPASQQIHGAIENKVGGLKSKLDSLLKRIETDAKLIPGGVEATLRVTAGPSGIPKVDLETAALTARWVEGKPSLEGKVGLRHESGKISGAAEFSYASGNFKVGGSVTVKDLVEGLDEFTAKVEYVAGTEATADAPATPESLKFFADKVAIKKKFKGVTIGGEATKLVYDAKAGSFSGDASLTADIGPFGTATGKASVKDNKLVEASLTHTTPKLEYPKKTPYISGTIESGLTYKDGKFGGHIKGDGKLTVGALKPIAPKGLDIHVEADIAADGGFSGKFTAKGLEFGKYVSIPLIELSLLADGDVEGKFGISIHKIPKIDDFTVTVGITKNGVTLEGFSVTGKIEQTSPKQRFWGSITVAYVKGGAITITVIANIKVRDGIVIVGTLTYTHAEGKDYFNGELSTKDEVVILDKSKDFEIVKNLTKQIPIVNVYGIGLYLEFGVGVTFGISFKLSFKPKLTLTNFNLQDLTFDAIAGQLITTGQIKAALTVEPKVGIGLFVLSPSILRAGGGLKIPITASATVDAGAEINVTYAKPKSPKTPDDPYVLDTTAQLSLSVKFGIDVAIVPYATFVILDGAYEKEWKGDPLAKFQILAPRELFRYTVDFNKGVKPNDEPKVGPNPDAAPKSGATEPVPAIPAARNTVVDETVPKNPPHKDNEPKNVPAPKDEDGGFSLASLLDKVKENGTYKAIKKVLDSVTGAFDAIGKWISEAFNFIQNWVGNAIDVIAAALERIKDKGFFFFVKELVGAKLNAISPDLWEIVEPLFTALQKSEATLMSTMLALASEPLPKSIGKAFEWAFKIIRTLFGGAWDSIENLTQGFIDVGVKLGSTGLRLLRRFVDKLIETGYLGAKQSDPWAYKVYLGKGFEFSSSTTTRLSGTYLAAKALCLALYGIKATHRGGDENYWVDE